MDSPTGLDDDDFFFGSYDADGASGQASHDSFEFDASLQPPSPEQRAHLERFRRPVAGIVGGMALLSIIALGVHGSQASGSQRQLVAHYGSSLAAPTVTATAATVQAGRAPVASSERVPDVWSALLTEAWSAFVPEASPSVNSAVSAVTIRASAPAPEPFPADTALTAFFTRPDASPIKTFIAAPSPMCLRLADRDAPLDSPGDQAGSPQSPSPGIISVPMTIEESTPAASTPAKPPAVPPAKAAAARPPVVIPAKPVAVAPAKPATVASAKPAATAAPALHAPFSSVARFPDPQR